MTEIEKHWMAIYTKPRSEKKVEKRLIEDGIEAYCPTYITLKQWSDRKKKVELPLLPSYVFVKIEEQKRQVVLNDPSVLNFVFWLGQPVNIKEDEILGLKEAHRMTSEENYSEGDIFEINSGAFKGSKGEVLKIEKNKLIIYLPSLRVRLVLNKNKKNSI
jgi:transcriptional antiterminator RfaH